MPLTNIHTNYLNGNYEDELRFLLKVAENDSLRRNPTNAAALAIGTDSKNHPVIGYGYDLVVNRGNTAVQALQNAGVVLTPTQIAAINAITATTTGIPADLAGLSLPSEAAATSLLNAAIAVRRTGNPPGTGFTQYLTQIGGLAESR